MKGQVDYVPCAEAVQCVDLPPHASCHISISRGNIDPTYIVLRLRHGKSPDKSHLNRHKSQYHNVCSRADIETSCPACCRCALRLFRFLFTPKHTNKQKHTCCDQQRTYTTGSVFSLLPQSIEESTFILPTIGGEQRTGSMLTIFIPLSFILRTTCPDANTCTMSFPIT